jgi:hypothetical protein
MLKKLSTALVAISLVAIAQSASAQTVLGKFQITIKQQDSFYVIATTGALYVPYQVTLDGVKISDFGTKLKPGMICDITQISHFAGINNYIDCKSK